MPVEHRVQQPIAQPNIDRSNYIFLPSYNRLISKQEYFKGATWKEAHVEAIKQQQAMPIIPIFNYHFLRVIDAAKGNTTLFDGNNQPIDKDEAVDLYKYLTTNHKGGCWTWLDAYFKLVNNQLHINYNHNLVDGKLQPKNSEVLERCLMEDCFADLIFNGQGLPTKKSTQQKYIQGNNISFWCPINNSVAGFGADADWAGLYCSRFATLSDPALGVFLCAEGTPNFENQVTTTLEDFILNNMTHEPKEKYLRSLRKELEDFRFIHLDAESKEADPDYGLLEGTKRALAGKAIKEDCKYVTDMDYCQYNPKEGHLIIAATGLIEKK